ncbi:MAG: non-heme iron oxygenase ferredoxin subunit [Gemmatimonadetes bacterium]|nr:non-heme iron oxygenase ferredoxin subunit [Gemmatimonadota bacterium]MDA1102047.1 non-heme iron oxygenase ferredoxin subunit [Gemmatimonadota bacterium]
MGQWVKVAAEGDCPVGKLKGVMAEGTPVVLANVDGTVCALMDRCSHEDYPLSDGELDGGDVVCIYHGARFDACSGARKSLPAIRPVRSFPVEIRDGDIYVDVG